MEQLAMGLRQAAEAVGLSHWTLRAYIRQGKIRGLKIGRRVLIEPSELERLVRQGRIEKDHNANNIQNLRA